MLIQRNEGAKNTHILKLLIVNINLILLQL
jgi:hypothetical protein